MKKIKVKAGFYVDLWNDIVIVYPNGKLEFYQPEMILRPDIKEGFYFARRLDCWAEDLTPETFLGDL